jgi:hypothetical protein
MSMTSARPAPALAYLVLVALSLHLLLGIVAPGIAAWSPGHAHVSLDGRVYPHSHAWDSGSASPGDSDEHSRTKSAPSNEGDSTVSLALPTSIILVTLAGAFVLTRETGLPRFRSISTVPTTPPPQR